ncbi:thylakoid lumenal protein TL20.3, chloroplastic isoform X2 [Vitis vinifera]|uniref:thylakoid lumenal protein TL20.3, chloroplastic isoform X2 n=1 Tax=Vitis vinifera TaxID=29760 RepID=UPI00053FA38C|nr:thylakoid lumenal protein TL20.3, chloroplastic isoform X2 [Vitis vinifera]|eukprot:XP_010662249.1 PREDICTED: thylakoid lumenal protein TL20.3, chloroplastic isoform X2 [Vitis vinifera]
MALSSVSPLYISKSPNHLRSLSKPFTVVCRIERQRENNWRGEANAESKKWQRLVSTALAAAVVTLSPVMPAVADLNKYEVETRGEFGIGSAAQFGSADLRKAVHVNENFRRANFTSADMRESDFSGSTFNGEYLEKAVAYKASLTARQYKSQDGEVLLILLLLAELELKLLPEDLSPPISFSRAGCTPCQTI